MISIMLRVTLLLGVTYNTCGVYLSTQYNVVIKQVSLIFTLFQLRTPEIQSIW